MNKNLWILKVLEAVAFGATCPKSAVGAIFVSLDYEILATGFNGAPRHLPHCEDTGCEKDKDGKCVTSVHAEINALVQGAKKGVILEGAMLFVSRWPCKRCAMMLANLNLAAIAVPATGRRNPEGEAVLLKARIESLVVHVDGSMAPLSQSSV